MKKNSLIVSRNEAGNIYLMDYDHQYLSLAPEIETDKIYHQKKLKYLFNHGIGSPKQKLKTKIKYQEIESLLINARQIVFEVTDACNLRCKYCGYGELYYDHDDRCNTKMTLKQIKPFLDLLENFWTKSSKSFNKFIYINFYGGEPLLNISFIKDVVEYIKEKRFPGKKFIYSMTTNATLLHKHTTFLVQNNFNLLISLDGSRDNNSYRVDSKGNNSFDTIIKNVALLRFNFPRFFEKHVHFNAVLHNKNSVSEIFEYIFSNYGKVPSIGELNNMGIRTEKVKEFNHLYRNEQESLHQDENYEKIEKNLFLQTKSYQDLGLFIHQYSGFVFKTYNDLLFRKNTKKYLSTGTCPPFSKKIFITVNGKILPCEKIGHQFSLGKILGNTVELDFETIATRYNIWFEKLFKQCTYCYRTDSCIQCIFNINNIDSNKVVCNGYMDAKDFAHYLAGNMTFLEIHPEDYWRIMNEVTIE